jgi:hypothetical protein
MQTTINKVLGSSHEIQSKYKGLLQQHRTQYNDKEWLNQHVKQQQRHTKYLSLVIQTQEIINQLNNGVDDNNISKENLIQQGIQWIESSEFFPRTNEELEILQSIMIVRDRYQQQIKQVEIIEQQILYLRRLQSDDTGQSKKNAFSML